MKALPWLALLAFALSADAQMYKWKDAAGRQQFTQLPPPAGVTYEVLGVPVAPQSASSQDALDQTQNQGARAAPEQPQAAEHATALQTARQQNCINALERTAYLDAHTARRLAVTDDKGNVARMSQDEFDRQRAAEQERVRQNCD